MRVRFSAVAADAHAGVAGQDAHNYDEIVEESKKELLAMVNRDRAVIDLLRMTSSSSSSILRELRSHIGTMHEDRSKSYVNFLVKSVKIKLQLLENLRNTNKN